MITRLEIDGFKTLNGIAFDIAPFQTIVGPLDAGASNVLDAIALLAGLADTDLYSAFAGVRGGPGDLFTIGPDGRAADRMTLACEMLVDATAEDVRGMHAEIRQTRLRYEVVIERMVDARGFERLQVAREALSPIARGADAWARRYLRAGRERRPAPYRGWRTTPFISTEPGGATPVIHLHQDGHGGDVANVAHVSERTVIAGIANAEFPHAFAVREEMCGWRCFAVEPHAVRGGRPAHAHTFIGSDGGNLIAALVRMNAEDPAALIRISHELNGLLPTVASVTLDGTNGFYRQRAVLESSEGAPIPLALLSDGALRLLAMVVLRNDADGGGVIALDEPENGLDTAALLRLAPYLRRLSSDPALSDAGSTDTEPDVEPDAGGIPDAMPRLRQGIVATHSRALLRAIADDAMVAATARGEEPPHDLPEILFVTRVGESGREADADVAGAGSMRADGVHGTRVRCVRASRQLELDLDGTPHGDTHATLADIENEL